MRSSKSVAFEVSLLACAEVRDGYPNPTIPLSIPSPTLTVLLTIPTCYFLTVMPPRVTSSEPVKPVVFDTKPLAVNSLDGRSYVIGIIPICAC